MLETLPLSALNTHSKMKMFSPKETRQQSYNMKYKKELLWSLAITDLII